MRRVPVNRETPPSVDDLVAAFRFERKGQHHESRKLDPQAYWRLVVMKAASERQLSVQVMLDAGTLDLFIECVLADHRKRKQDEQERKSQIYQDCVAKAKSGEWVPVIRQAPGVYRSWEGDRWFNSKVSGEPRVPLWDMQSRQHMQLVEVCKEDALEQLMQHEIDMEYPPF